MGANTTIGDVHVPPVPSSSFANDRGREATRRSRGVATLSGTMTFVPNGVDRWMGGMGGINVIAVVEPHGQQCGGEEAG
jgi:hypothetical protein